MKRNYFKTLFHCVLTSVVLLGAATVFHMHPIVAMIGGISPLVFYHLGYLRPQAKFGLTQAAIDSVYYFGFLVTVAALGISALVIASSGGAENLDTVVYQFGVGLFATGYAVVARMHLSSISIMVEDASPEALLDRYVKKSVELITNVEMASDQLMSFSSNLMEKSSQVAESARLMVERTMVDTTKVFEEEMRRSLESARDSLTTIRGLVADTSFANERTELAKSMAVSIEATVTLNKALAELAQRTNASTHATDDSILTASALEQKLRLFVAQIGELGGEDGAIPSSIESLQAASKTIAECNIAMADAAVGLSDIVSVVSDTGPTFKTMRTLAKKASEQLDGLAEASKKLGSAAESITDAAVASDSLAVGMSKVTSAFAPLTTETQAFTAQMSSASLQTERLELQLVKLPLNVTSLKEIGDQVATSLSEISDVIDVALRQSKEISTHTTESTIAMDAARKLLMNSDSLQISIQALQKVFDGLSESVTLSQKSISESSAEIKGSIARSSQSLELDVARSAEATSLLTSRLTQVAQTIIDRTKHPEAV